MNKYHLHLLSIVAITMSSCAASYHHINPAKVNYPFIHVKDTSVVLQYKYNVLSMAGNKKYFKKEAKFNTFLLAVKITNNTDSVIITNKLQLLSGNAPIRALTPIETKKLLSQKAGFHLFYLLFTPVQLYTESSTTPIGLVLGPSLTLINLLVAMNSNRKFMENLTKYSMEKQSNQTERKPLLSDRVTQCAGTAALCRI